MSCCGQAKQDWTELSDGFHWKCAGYLSAQLFPVVHWKINEGRLELGVSVKATKEDADSKFVKILPSEVTQILSDCNAGNEHPRAVILNFVKNKQIQEQEEKDATNQRAENQAGTNQGSDQGPSQG